MKYKLLPLIYFTFPIIFLLFAVGSCNQSGEKLTRKAYLKSFNCPIKGKKSLKIDKIDLNKVCLENANSSLQGSIYFRGNRQYFVDYRFCWVFEYDLNGKLLNRKVGRGKGPLELPVSAIDAFQFDQSGNAYFMGPNYNVYVFDKNWKRENGFLLEKHYLRDTPVPEKDINPSNLGLYSIEYLKFILRFGRGYFYIPVGGSYPEIYSPYSSIDHYLQCFTLAKFDSKSGKFLELQGRRTPELLNYSFLSQFEFFSYDLDLNDNMYVGHEIDSLIYYYDDKQKLINKFGFAGQEMRCDYQGYSGRDIVRMQADRLKFSYYDWIEYIDETGLLFRSYFKNPSCKYDGLQIYGHGDLFGDINVPKGFQVRYYKEPFYYSNVFIDEEANAMWVYKFTLPR